MGFLFSQLLLCLGLALFDVSVYAIALNFYTNMKALNQHKGITNDK